MKVNPCPFCGKKAIQYDDDAYILHLRHCYFTRALGILKTWLVSDDNITAWNGPEIKDSKERDNDKR